MTRLQRLYNLFTFLNTEFSLLSWQVIQFRKINSFVSAGIQLTIIKDMNFTASVGLGFKYYAALFTRIQGLIFQFTGSDFVGCPIFKDMENKHI